MSDASETPKDAPTLRSPPGRIGRYEIQRPLGKGAMGVVYLAHDTVLERDVALKVMVPQIADDPELNKRFEREAKAVARMTHPNVVAVFDLGQHEDGSPYIAMELLKGQDLQKAMRSPVPLSLERKVGIIVQVLAGLAHAHGAGIVHRDIKPANIFLNHDGAAKIMDFGVAHVTTGSMTGTGHVVGTADYMSPEQVKGAKVDGRSDLFAVGCMLYELICGRRPFHAESLMAIFYKITHDEPDWEKVPGGEQYDGLLPILQKAMHKDPDQRYATAYEFAVELRDYLLAHVSGSGAHALENLLEGEGPGATPAVPGFGTMGPTLVSLSEIPSTTPPVQATNVQPTAGPAPAAPGAALPAATPAAPAARAGTLRGAPTAVEPGLRTETPPATVRPREAPPARRPATRPPPPRPRPAPPAPSRAPLVGGVLALLVAAAGGYVWLQQRRPAPPTPAASLAPPPSPVALPSAEPSAPPTPLDVATPSAPPPSPAPPPSFAPAQGKGAAALLAAQAAFKKGDYARAEKQAQAALQADPQDAGAQGLLEQASAGLKARAQLEAADAALRQGELERAQAAADQARALAPWEAGIPGLYTRLNEARARAQQQAQQQAQQTAQQQSLQRVAQVLNDADSALQAQKYEDALRLYDEALKLDPQNAAARAGRTTAIGLKSAPAARPAGRTFAAERTRAEAARRAGSDLPPGFEKEKEADVKVQKGTQAGGELAGKLLFEVSPEGVKTGDHFSVRIYLLNEGTAPIQVAGLQITTTLNGKRSGGPVPSRAREVGPGDKALLHEIGALWGEDYASWSIDVSVSTPRGDRYSNRLASQ